MSNKPNKPKQTVSHGMVVDLSQMLLGLVQTRVFNIKADSESPTRKVNMKLDFSQCSIEWLLGKALRTIIIDQQRVLRQLGDDELLALEESGVKNVLLDPTPTRVKLTEKQKVERLLGKLSEEDKQKLIETLTTK